MTMTTDPFDVRPTERDCARKDKAPSKAKV